MIVDSLVVDTGIILHSRFFILFYFFGLVSFRFGKHYRKPLKRERAEAVSYM